MDRVELFEWLATELEDRTSLKRLEARGTARLALKEAGLDPASVTPGQLKVVLQRVLPGALRVRGVGEADEVSRGLLGALAELLRSQRVAAIDTVYEAFARLDGKKREPTP